MKQVSMTGLSCALPGRRGWKIYVPGGWTAYVGEVSLDSDTLAVYADYLGSADKAASLAQRVFEGGFLAGLRAAVKRRAQEYASRWPELVEEKRDWRRGRYVTLRGFDPEAIQATYVPFDNYGKKGKEFAAEMLEEMAAAALAGRRAA